MTQPDMEAENGADLLKALQEKLEKQREEQRTEAERLQQEREDLQRLSSRQSSQAAPSSESLGDGGRTFVNFKITQPPTLEECSCYDMYKKKLQLWELSSELPVKKMASLVIASLTNDSKFKRGLADKFLEKHTVVEMTGNDGLNLVKAFLEKELGEKVLNKTIGKWDEFEDCKRGGGEDIQTFVDRFDRAYTSLRAVCGARLPSEIRAFMLLKRSGVEGVNRSLVLSKLDFTKADTLYEQVETQIVEILGGGPGAKKGTGGLMRVEAVPVPGEEGCFMIGDQKFKKEAPKRKKEQDWGERKKDKNGKLLNRMGPDGKVLTCFKCQSQHHFANQCDAGEVALHVGVVGGTEHIVLISGEMSMFTWEARGAAALDSCCSSSVAGRAWLDMYIEDLEEVDKAKVIGPEPSEKIFSFGNNGQLKSEGRYIIPGNIHGTRVTVSLDIISSDIPLLISKRAMKAAGISINFKDDEIEAFGRKAPLYSTASGHPILKLQQLPGVQGEAGGDVLHVLLAMDFVNGGRTEQKKGLRRLHRQFGHCPQPKFLHFLRSTKIKWHKELEEDLEEIMGNCVGCLQRRRNPDRPAVALPMAGSFNEKVAVDLKVLSQKNIYILHMIDMWSRLTISVIISRKRPRDVVDAMCRSWIAYFGTPAAVLNDQGGEFTGSEVVEMKSLFNIEDLTTAAYSPWQNGLCEKGHQVIDAMLEAMERDHPDYPLDVLLSWVCMVKNTMYDHHGFTPNQLVYGTNPTLPNVLTEGLPGMEGKTSSEVLAMHINSLQAARQAFTSSEASEKVRLALKKKIRTNNELYYPEDRVYWKHSHENRWRGPGKVLIQDGKQIFIRSGARIISTSVNRIVRVGEEFGTKMEVGGGLGERLDRQEAAGQGEPQAEELADTEKVTRSMSRGKRESSVGEMVVEIMGEGAHESEEVEELMEEPLVEGDLVFTNAEETDPASATSEESLPVSTLAEETNPASVFPEENLPTSALAGESDPAAATLEESIPASGTSEESIPASIPEPADLDDSTLISADGKRKRGREQRGLTRNVRQRGVATIQHLKNVGVKIQLRKGESIEVLLEGEKTPAQILSRGKVGGDYYNYFNIKTVNGLEYNIDLERNNWERISTEQVMMSIIPRARHGELECRKAKDIEIKKLKDWGAYKIVKDEGQFRISSTWVLWMKQKPDGEEEVRARLVARGYEEECEVPSDSPTIDQVNIKILLALCAANRWTPKTSDVKSAFLQGRQLDRLVTMKPPREAGLGKDSLWELEVALYGLDDASLQFYLKCKDIFLNLGLTQSKMDPALFYRLDEEGQLDGALETHVDDFLHGGSESFTKEITDRLANIFEMGKTESQNFKYVGFKVEQDPESFAITLDQQEYAEKIEMIKISPERALKKGEKTTDEETTEMRRAAGRLGWLGRGTRPDLLFSQIEISTKFVSGVVGDLMLASTALRKVKSQGSYLLIRDLGDVRNWSIEISTDASFKNLNDGVHSTAAGVILIRNSGNLAVPVMWYANKIRRVCGSTLEAETLSLVEGMGQAVYVKQVIEEICGMPENTIPVHAFIDHKGAYEAIHSTVAVEDRRLRSEMARAKDYLIRGEINTLSWVSGKKMLADSLTKRTASSYNLLRVLQTGKREQEE